VGLHAREWPRAYIKGSSEPELLRRLAAEPGLLRPAELLHHLGGESPRRRALRVEVQRPLEREEGVLAPPDGLLHHPAHQPRGRIVGIDTEGSLETPAGLLMSPLVDQGKSALQPG